MKCFKFGIPIKYSTYTSGPFRSSLYVMGCF